MYGVEGECAAATPNQHLSERSSAGAKPNPPSSVPSSILSIWAYREGTKEQVDVDEDEEADPRISMDFNGHQWFSLYFN